MSLSSDILTLNSALNSFTYAESVIAENVANAQTPGYTAQVANLESIQDFGGVAVAGVSSTRNVYLYNQLYSQLALQGFSTAQLSALDQLSGIIPEVTNPAATDGLSAAINNLSTAWSALSAAPTSVAAQTAVVNDMQTLAGLFQTDSNLLHTLQQNLDTQVSQAVTQVNTLEGQILTLNKEIVALGGNQNAQTSTLMDQREQDAEQLASLTGGSVNYATNGAMIITFSGGTLVDGVTTYPLEAIPSRTQPGMISIGYVGTPNDSTPADVTADFTSGTLGGLYSGQASVASTIQSLNQMAFGIIQFSNEVNESAAGVNGTVNMLFDGEDAADISVNPDVSAIGGEDLALAGNGDPANAGNLAQVQAGLNSLNLYSEIETENPAGGGIENTMGVPVDPNATLASQLALGLWAVPNPAAGGGTMVINVGGNAVNVVWNTAMSLNQIVAEINANGGGAVYATLQTVPTGSTVEPSGVANGIQIAPGQFVHIYSNAPVSIYDASGNLAYALQLAAYASSTAPVNAVPVNGVNTVDPGQALNYAAPGAPDPGTVDNPLSLFTQPMTPPAGGTWTADVNGDTANEFTWTPSQSIDTILGDIPAPAGTTLYTGFFQAGSPATLANLHAQEAIFYAVANGDPSVAQPLTTFSIGDVTGNLSQVLNLGNAKNPLQTLTQLATTLSDTTAAAQSQKTQAGNLVSATEALQTQQSGVDVNAQLAQATVYQNAYDAAVRMQYILENMLNYLITQTGSPNASGPAGNS
ncbi:MAG: flagellar hook-associated protein FlgK [bacterium]